MKVLKSKQQEKEACTNISFIALVKKFGGPLKINLQKSQNTSEELNYSQ